MALIKVLWFLFYLCLSFGAFVFVLKNLYDFMEGKTYYHSAKEQITLIDIPSLTLCWPLNNYLPVFYYEKDFSIEVKFLDSNDKPVTLKENKSIRTSFDIDLHLSKVWPKSSLSFKCLNDLADLQCFKITPKLNGNSGNHGITKLGMQIAFKPSIQTKFTDNAYVRILATSEENSYGLAGGRWYDGNVDCSKLKSGYVMKIEEVKEYINLNSTCSMDSYYECLAKRFHGVNFRAIKGEKFKDCPFNQTCSPY